jgi:hypothetical protein
MTAAEALRICMYSLGSSEAYRRPGGVVGRSSPEIREALRALRSDDACIADPHPHLLRLVGIERAIERRRGRMSRSFS